MSTGRKFFQLAVDKIPCSLSHSRAHTSTCFEFVQRLKTHNTLKIRRHVKRAFECLGGTFFTTVAVVMAARFRFVTLSLIDTFLYLSASTRLYLDNLYS